MQALRWAIALAMGAHACPVPAANGDIDLTFGSNGVALSGIVAPSTTSAPIVQPDGKILVCGSQNDAAGIADFFVARFMRDGVLDATFGSGGIATADFGGNWDVCLAVAVQDDGKIVAAGWTSPPHAPPTTSFAVAQFDSDGSLDQTFAAGGTETIAFSNEPTDAATSVAIQADGGIVLAGYTYQNWGMQFAFARLDRDGTPDNTFNGTGQTIINANLAGGDSDATGVAIDDQQRIVAAGDAFPNVAVVRLLPDGEADAAFGSGGRTNAGFGVNQSAGAAGNLVLQSDGKIVVAGSVDTDSTSGYSNDDMAAYRFLDNGAPDAEFGSDGVVEIPFDLETDGSDYANGIVLQSDGKLVLAGRAEPYGGIARLNADGTPDASFGVSGKRVYAFAAAGLDGANFSGIAWQDQRLIVASDGAFVARLSDDPGQVFASGFDGFTPDE